MSEATFDAPRDDVVRQVPFKLDRDAQTDGLTLSGHAAVFNQWTTIDSWEGKFRERIAPGAFRKTLRESGGKVVLQFDHGHHPLVGSLPLGKIDALREDGVGLFVEARLHDNWLVQPVRDAIESGAISGMSFRFAVEKESWAKVDSDLPERTITEVRLFELGPVVFPAYEGTDVGVRAMEIARSIVGADTDTLREIARAIEVLSADPDTPDPEAADDGTSGGAVDSRASEEAEEITEPPSHSGTYKPAARPRLTASERAAQLAFVRAAAELKEST